VPPDLGARAAQHHLDLGVGAAQFIGGPPGQRVVHGRIKPQQDRLALSHSHHIAGTRYRFPAASLVKRSRVDDGLGRVLAAQDDHQIADHGGLALLV
jgi:hypothetical protein